MKLHSSFKPWIIALCALAIFAAIGGLYIWATKGSDPFILYDTLSLQRVVYFIIIYHFQFPVIWGTALLVCYILVARFLSPVKLWVSICHCITFFSARIMLFFGWYLGRVVNFDTNIDADGSPLLAVAFNLNILGSRLTYLCALIMIFIIVLPFLRTKQPSQNHA